MDDIQALYKAIGRKIREARERSADEISQNRLAKRLGVSRASVVNIEAGRQHAPVSLLWKIANTLGVELVTLIPRRRELSASTNEVKLSDKMRKQIAVEAKGNAKLKKSLTSIVGRLLTTIEPQQNTENNEQE